MRDLNKEAWFLYQVTSVEYFERCALACQEFAEVFDQIMTKHDAHGYANLDYWMKAYYSAAKNIRRDIELAKLGDYMPLMEELRDAKTSYRGMIDQPLGWMTAEEEAKWDAAFSRLSSLCGNSVGAMQNNEWKGINWAEREEHKDEPDFQEMLDRDDGTEGIYIEQAIDEIRGNILLQESSSYPNYFVDKSHSCRAGETCPWTGVWVPEQALTEGLEKFSIAFAMAGRPMQPAYRIVKDVVELIPSTLTEGDRVTLIWPEEPGAADYERHIETKAEDALWYPVLQIESDTVAEAPAPTHGRLRAEPNDLVPKTGWWHSQAKPNGQALHYFEAGQRFPDWHTTHYGSVIWGFKPDEQKEPPKR